MVKKEEESLAAKYKVTKYPAFFILKNGEKAPIRYEDDDFSYAALFEFINTYSETFVFKQTQGDDAVESKATRPWLSEKVAFLSKESANDLCLKKEGILCVIYVVPEASKSDPAFLEAIDYVKDYFTSNIERGITFSYSRLDVSVESEFASVFELEEGQVPGIVVLNPGKKKRFMKSDKPLT